MSQVIIIPTTTTVIINTTGIPPLPGTIGEQIRSFLDSTSALSLTSGVIKTVTSITLTPGIWDVTAIADFTSPGLTATVMKAAISDTINSFATTVQGDNKLNSNAFPTTGNNAYIVIPAFRINVTATHTWYLVSSCAFTAGSISAYGRLSAVRVA